MMSSKEQDRILELDQKRIFAIAAAICLVIGIIGSFFTDWVPFFTGLAFGLIINILCFRLLYIDCMKIVGRDPGNAKKIGSTGYVKRYLIKGAALYAGIVSDRLQMWGVFIGLISISAAIHLINFVQIIKNKKKG